MPATMQRNEAAQSDGFATIAMQSLLQGVVMQGSDGKIVWSNPAAAQILGMSEDQLWGRDSMDPGWAALHEDDSPWPGDTHPAMVALATGLPVVDAIMGVHRPDGSRVWLSVSALPTTLPDGQAGVTVVFVDVTGLRQEAVRQRIFFEHGGVPTVVVDWRTGLLVDVNEALCEWLGYRRVDLLGAAVAVVLDSYDEGRAFGDSVQLNLDPPWTV